MSCISYCWFGSIQVTRQDTVITWPLLSYLHVPHSRLYLSQYSARRNDFGTVLWWIRYHKKFVILLFLRHNTWIYRSIICNCWCRVITMCIYLYRPKIKIAFYVSVQCYCFVAVIATTQDIKPLIVCATVIFRLIWNSLKFSLSRKDLSVIYYLIRNLINRKIALYSDVNNWVWV